MQNADQPEFKELPSEMVAYIEGRGSYLLAEELFGRVRSWAVTMGYSRKGPESLVFLDDPDPTPESGAHYEVWTPVSERARTTPDDPVQVKQVPAQQALIRTLTGPQDPQQIEPLYVELNQWLSANGYDRSGAARWVYEQDPARLAVDQQLVTEFIFPVTKRGA
ncbi:MAG: GyrI-like domain-containing protein [Dehalococcoidia bacterium]